MKTDDSKIYKIVLGFPTYDLDDGTTSSIDFQKLLENNSPTNKIDMCPKTSIEDIVKYQQIGIAHV